MTSIKKMHLYFRMISIHEIYIYYMIENKKGTKALFNFFIKFFINIIKITLYEKVY